MAKEHLGVRVESSVKAKIKELIDAHEYRDYSDFAERAIREKLDRETGANRAAFREQLIEAFESDPEVTAAVLALVDRARTLSHRNR